MLFRRIWSGNMAVDIREKKFPCADEDGREAHHRQDLKVTLRKKYSAED